MLQPFFPFSVMADTNFAFPLTLRKPETQTLGGSVIGSFALGTHFWGAMAHFFPFSVIADTNFAFPSTLRKTGDPNFRGSVIGSFALGTRFWGATAILPIFCNGRQQCSDTWKTGMTFLHSKGQNGWRKFSVDSVFSAGSVSPPRLLGSFQHLGMGTHKCLKHLGVTFLHSQKVPKKIHQNRLHTFMRSRGKPLR